MSGEEDQLVRHPSLDDRLDPAVRLVAHDPLWAALAAQELARIGAALGKTAMRLEHVCLHGSAHEARHLAVREFLRAHAKERMDYEAVKREAVALSPGDRLGYMERKRGFLDELEKRALTWRSRTSRG